MSFYSEQNEIRLQKKMDLLALMKKNMYFIPDGKVSGIYAIYNTDNDKIYFGKSKDVRTRLYRHRNDLFRNTHRCKKMQKDFNNKLTEESFIGCMVQTVDEDLLNEAEHYFIKYFESYIFGYNVQLPTIK